MDDAIEFNRMALLRMVAAIAAMAGLGGKSANQAADRGAISRNFYLMLLRLLRPAEAAARRLVVAVAHRLPPVKALAPLVSSQAGGLVQLPRTYEPGMMIPPHLFHPASPSAPTAATSDGQADAPPRADRGSRFRLLDPLPDPFPEPRRGQITVLPRIWSFEDDSGFRPLEPDKPAYLTPAAALMAARARQRLAALSRVLRDLPKQAQLYLRWQARRDRALLAGQPHRLGALRPGRPPGALRHDPALKPNFLGNRMVEEIDGILTDAHNLARRSPLPRSMVLRE